MEPIGALGLRGGIDLARKRSGEAFAGRGGAVVLKPAFDGARAGQRAEVQALQLGRDGGGADQALPGGRLGVGLGRRRTVGMARSDSGGIHGARWRARVRSNWPSTPDSG
jgi:hypothetical protein